MQVKLTWNSVAGASSYNVKRGTVSGGPYAQISSNVQATAFSDTSVSPGTTYFYVVTAVDQAGNESGPSNQATVAVPAIAAPTGLLAVEEG